MPMEDKTVEKQRKEFAEKAQTTDNFSALCREYNITRKTGYKWKERYANNEPMTDRSKVPNKVANRTPYEIEQQILQVRYENPKWVGKQIQHFLEMNGVENIPCSKTIGNILKRKGCISKEASLAHQPYKRFERSKCNQMWQTDFKGDFGLLDGTRCYPLDILDDHSRFCIKIAVKPNLLGVLDSFQEAFYEYGIPNSVLSDNGGTFRGLHGGYTQFEKWLMNNDVLPIHGRVKHPQTQGKIERFHRTMKEELLNIYQFNNLSEADLALQEWRNKYNYTRGHHALNMKCPGEVYEPSQKKYTGIIKPYEYSGEYHVIKVNSWGYLRFAKWQEYLSETMIGEQIELRPSQNGSTFIACYRNFRIAEFDADTGKRLNRKIARI